jgi:hypothetical protein
MEMKSEFSMPDSLTNDQYNKVIHILVKINQQIRKIDSRINSIKDSDGDDIELMLESCNLSIEAIDYSALAMHVKIVACEGGGDAELAAVIKKELGNNWYYQWKNINKETEDKDKYSVGLAYELVFGTANEGILLL